MHALQTPEARLCMQNVERAEHGNAMVGSEFLCLFQIKIVGVYMNRIMKGCPLHPRHTWDEKCKEHAERIGMADQWAKVHIPINFSLDNASIHGHTKQAMLRPRLARPKEYAVLDKMACEYLQVLPYVDRFKAALELLKENAQKKADEAKAAGANMTKEQSEAVRDNGRWKKCVDEYFFRQLHLDEEDVYDGDSVYGDDVEHNEAVQEQIKIHRFAARADDGSTFGQTRWAAGFAKRVNDLANQELQNHLDIFEVTYGMDFWDWARREMAAKDPRWLCLLPMQWMPLVEIAPDIHQTGEVVVRTYKGCNKRYALSLEPDDKNLQSAGPFQKHMLQYQRKRQRVKDKYMAQRSIQKMKCTLEILAGEIGESATCRYTFDKSAKEKSKKRKRDDPEDVHIVPCTAGQWIPGNKWN